MDEVTEYKRALTEYLLAAQQVINAVRRVLPVAVSYWQCEQTTEHFFDFDDWRLLWGGDHWRTQGKVVCPKCAGILELRIAKVYKHRAELTAQ